MTKIAKELVKNHIVYDVVDIWGGNDLPAALEKAAHYLRGLEKTSSVEHVIATEDGSQGWFVSLTVKHILKVDHA